MEWTEVEAALIAGHLGGLRRRTGLNHEMYLRHWGAWLASQPGTPRLLDATTDHVRAWLAGMLDGGLTGATAIVKLAAVRAIYARAEMAGLIARDPTRGVRGPRRARRATGLWLGRDGVRSLLAAADAHASPGLRATIYLWTLSGLRPAEPFGLDVPDVVLHGGLTTVTLGSRKGGDASVLSIADRTAGAVRDAIAGRARGPLLLNAGTGERYVLPRAREHFRSLLRRHTDLDARLAPYGLRATFITLSLEAGVSERVVAACADHATTSMIPVYDRRRAQISAGIAATHRLAAWLDEDRP